MPIMSHAATASALSTQSTIFVGNTIQKSNPPVVAGEFVHMLGEPFYKIHHFDGMPPFFMSLVSSADYWLFISTTGGLSAGQCSAENALFPYYTDDKITENSENTGSKAILLVDRDGRRSLWEPFSVRHQGLYTVERNLYKNVTGSVLVFEEINTDLRLTYRYAWRMSNQFGFVRTTWVRNMDEAGCVVELVDGIQNLLPANIRMQTQNQFSPLLDAYKRSELVDGTSLAIFTLNSTLTDLAEPSESLLATTVLQVGLPEAATLLSSAQLERFRVGQGITAETEIRGRRCAYFVHVSLPLTPHEERSWHLVANVSQDSAAVMATLHQLKAGDAALTRALEDDITASQRRLWKLVASADGVQVTRNPVYAAYHFANVMFNVMRGGIFIDHYWVQASDFKDFVAVHNRPLLSSTAEFFARLPTRLQIEELQARVDAAGLPDLIRLSNAYLPLTFSRRHGDPSRPWNRFSINTRRLDGSQNLDYQGNWRDIFQNWEALAYAYPQFIENMIATFLNATTIDGYNPYRITFDGLDWEAPEPGNPWANIGYWSDHQIIYLQKLMEISVKFHPGKLQQSLARAMFSSAQVPYRIKPYAALLADPYNTIAFDWDLDHQVERRCAERGTDGKLIPAADGSVLHVTLAEKLLVLLLAKLTNFVPEGGIWMNTQRPEWNDANNALVGKGLSVVTLGYLRRYLVFCIDLFNTSRLDTVALSAEVGGWFTQIDAILRGAEGHLSSSFTPEARRALMDALGEAGAAYRQAVYQHGLSGETVGTSSAQIGAFLALAQRFVEHSLRANKRDDNLYHAYNVLKLEPAKATVGHLYEMLEGQVSILSSGLLSGAESLALLRALRHSALYRADQHSYILYPDRNPLGFLQKNCLTADQVRGLALFGALMEAHDTSLITRDVDGVYHFNGQMRNFNDVHRALDALKQQPRYAPLVDAEYDRIRDLFEATFHHDEFTGRSGTFFAYEGLGSIYWHMVAKLLLAVQETAERLRSDPLAPDLKACYVDIGNGLSLNKTPREYGAFPTDPYSHTPKGQGAKQPGMTGFVKEVILTRQVELGYTVANGQLVLDLWLFDRGELLTQDTEWTYLDVEGHEQTLPLKTGSLAYTICQTPIILDASGDAHGSAASGRLIVYLADGTHQHMAGSILDRVNSAHIFNRDGVVHHIVVVLPPSS
jgi:hypothetical protein